MKKFLIPVSIFFSAFAAVAQQPQIPTLQVCNGTEAAGQAVVHIGTRQDAGHTGNFEINLKVGCDPAAAGFPGGSVSIQFSLSDGSITSMQSSTIEQLTTTGKQTPTMFLNGRCAANTPELTIPCHYWLLLSNNRPAKAEGGTPDIVSVLVVDRKGQRLNYGTGPVVKGDINVVPTGN